MKWVDNSGGEGFQRPDPGTYLARCVRLIDLGTDYGEYQGKPTVRHRVMVVWELPEELIPTGDYAGEPYLVSKFYTASLNEKATLRHDLITWRGRDFTAEELEGFEAKNILGVPCLVSLTETEGGKAKVTAVTSLPKGSTVPKQINPTLFFSLEPGEFDQGVFDGLSDKIRAMIEKSPEYRDLINGVPVGTEPDESKFDDDSIPF